MTRLNLTETCLLEASGELGMKAHQQLREHIAKFPAAQLEYEVIKGQYQLLRSIPRPALSEGEKRRIASDIKQGLHRKLRKLELQEQAQRRWKLAYKALAGISAAAACIVVGTAIYSFNASAQNNELQKRIDGVKIAIDSMNNSGGENDTDRAIHDVAANIDELQNGSPAILSAQSSEMNNLLEVLSNVPSEEEVPPTPGSLQ